MQIWHIFPAYYSLSVLWFLFHHVRYFSRSVTNIGNAAGSFVMAVMAWQTGTFSMNGWWLLAGQVVVALILVYLSAVEFTVPTADAISERLLNGILVLPLVIWLR